MSLRCITPRPQPKTLLTGGLLLDTDCGKALPGEILFENGIILATAAPGTLSRDGANVIDVQGALISPGLVDIHTHGRAGGDFNDADSDTLLRMSRSYVNAGVTTVMPTLASAPINEYIAAARRIACAAEQCDGARFLGLHLEGRYLNPRKRGAHAQELIAPLSAEELVQLHRQMCQTKADTSPMPFRLSAALELDTDGSFLRAAKLEGITLSLGHTEASYEVAMALTNQGVGCFTHLFNAMPPLHHRDGGAVAACFDSRAFGEIICDGFHIAPHMVRQAFRLLGRERTVLVSDSMMGTGCPDGRYTIAGMDVDLRNGKAYTTDGAIAGSTLGLLDGVKNLMCFCQISLAEALCCATVNPARAAKIDHMVGSLHSGLAADFLLLRQTDGDIVVERIYVGGTEKEGIAS